MESPEVALYKIDVVSGKQHGIHRGSRWSGGAVVAGSVVATVVGVSVTTGVDVAEPFESTAVATGVVPELSGTGDDVDDTTVELATDVLLGAGADSDLPSSSPLAQLNSGSTSTAKIRIGRAWFKMPRTE